MRLFLALVFTLLTLPCEASIVIGQVGGQWLQSHRPDVIQPDDLDLENDSRELLDDARDDRRLDEESSDLETELAE